jgi:hypothetical protein
MDFNAFRNCTNEVAPVGAVWTNPGGGVSTIISVSAERISYRRGKSVMSVSIWDLFDAYALYRGRRVSTTELRAFRPVVFDSAARPAGHSCNCTIFFLLLERMGVVEGIQGKGVCGNPFYVDISL